jgi:PAS domain S-box-containing protein
MNNASPTLVSHHSMRANQEEKSFNLNFRYLPAFANFILQEKLNEFAIAQLKYSRELKLPLLKYLDGYSEEQLIQLGIKESVLLLTSLANDQAREFIEASLKRWIDDQLPMIARDNIGLEDIGLINLMRKKAFRALLPLYSTDQHSTLEIIDELDEFTVAQDAIGYRNLFMLQQSLYKEAQALSNIGNWIWDLKSNSITWSEEMYRIYELEVHNGLNYNNLYTFNHPDDIEIVKKEVAHSLATGESHDFYYRIKLRNGTQKFVHAKGHVRFDAEGKPIHLFGTLQDVTALKKNEQAILDKQNLIQKIADVTPCLIAAYNIHTGKYIFVNMALKTLLGYDPDDVKGVEFFTDLMHPDDLAVITRQNNEALTQANAAPDKNLIVAFKYRLKNKIGEYRWFHTYGTVFNRNKNNEVEEVLNVSLDVTKEYLLNLKLDKANEEIRRKDESYHRMIDDIQDYAIIMLDKAGNILNWNKGAEKIKGYKAEEVIGRNFRIFYTSEDLAVDRPDMLIHQAIEKGKAVDEGWRVRKDASRFWGSTVITVLHDDDNNIIGFSKITRDLTERKIAEDRLFQYANSIEVKNKQLESSNAELASFAYISSHDLREPLRKIKIFANRIFESESLSETGSDYFTRILSATDRMQNLIDALLSYSRVTSTEMITETTDLNFILRDVIDSLKEEIEEKKAVIESDELPTLKVVPVQFQQLFINLISNSLKYSKPDATPYIKISSELVKTPNAPLNIDDYYKISIADNGIGFEQKYADRIFELFQRLHTRTEFEGTGIGLSICKKIVQNHNGVIDASGEPGKGSTFNIYLPAQKTKQVVN